MSTADVGPEKKIPPIEATLEEGEVHPSAHTAYVWFNRMVVEDPVRYMQIRESLASTAIDGNRLAALCTSTLDRLENNQPVSDRYMLGLCWFLRDMIERKPYEPQEHRAKEDRKSKKGVPTSGKSS